MGLSRYKLGDLLVRNLEVNQTKQYGITDVRGLLNTKEISMNTKADMSGRDLSKFLVVRPGGFVFNHRVHDKLGLGYNTSENTYIFTNDYVAFYVKPEVKNHILLPDYLYMWYLRPEFDRYMLYKTYGSATLFFSWDNMCELEINIPSIDIQQKYVDVYNAMLANQQSYERGLEDLKRTFEALLDEYKHKAIKKPVKSILCEVDNRNTYDDFSDVQGINIEKKFMPSVANIVDVDLTKYKVVQKGQFAFSGMQTGRDECIRIALHDADEPIIISPAYAVLDMNCDDVLREYVMMWFSRKEVDRLGWFLSDGSIRTNLDMDRFYEIEIPIPDITVQKLIVEIYEAYQARKAISETLKSQLKNICPILIKGSIEEARKEA